MSKYIIDSQTLTDIADAVREKKETSEPILVSDLADEIESIEGGGNIESLSITSNGTYTASGDVDGYSPITVNVPQDGAPTSAELTFTDNLSYWDYQGNFDWLITKYGSQMTFNNINQATRMFEGCKLTNIPITINFKANYSCFVQNMFSGCSNLTTLPTLNNLRISYMGNFLEYCINLTDASSLNNLDFVNLHSNSIQCSSVFYGCRKLRTLPQTFIENFYNGSGTTGSLSNLSNTFNECYSLDYILNYPPAPNNPFTSDRATNFITNTSCLKRLTFKLSDGSPMVVPWKNQVINLSTYTGYFNGTSIATQCFDTIRYTTKRITDAASYETLKNDPDRWTTDVNYSLYDHDSAVETINTLPDCSATGTSTIKFMGAAGALTDAGAINTLTAAEIAVATAKGWTVTLV